MAESESHHRAKLAAAGTRGRVEKPLRGGLRLDALAGRRATEVERAGSTTRLEKAVRRLTASGQPRQVLQVPQPNMHRAAAAARRLGAKVTVKNISGTKRLTVRGR